MILRLVDCGIPTFEWKFKKVEIFYSDEELNELKIKVDLGLLDAKKAFKKRFEYRDAFDVNFNLYRNILQKLPNKPGCLVLVKAKKDSSLEIIEIFKSDIDLREDFKYSKKQMIPTSIDRYAWLKKVALEDDVCEIRFLLGKVA